MHIPVFQIVIVLFTGFCFVLLKNQSRIIHYTYLSGFLSLFNVEQCSEFSPFMILIFLRNTGQLFHTSFPKPMCIFWKWPILRNSLHSHLNHASLSSSYFKVHGNSININIYNISYIILPSKPKWCNTRGCTKNCIQIGVLCCISQGESELALQMHIQFDSLYTNTYIFYLPIEVQTHFQGRRMGKQSQPCAVWGEQGLHTGRGVLQWTRVQGRR